jgi:hypothetical protein
MADGSDAAEKVCRFFSYALAPQHGNDKLQPVLHVDAVGKLFSSNAEYMMCVLHTLSREGGSMAQARGTIISTIVCL